ncbi:MAG: hypothetical protein Q9177_000032, partial [Variospora cf. flavescens]
YQDPNPTVLHRFFIPADDALVSIRLFDQGMLMEIIADPDRVGRRKPVGDYWAITFRAHSKQEHKNARAMMRRIKSLTREMPFSSIAASSPSRPGAAAALNDQPDDFERLPIQLLAPSGAISINVIKKGKRDKVLSKRETRRAQRSLQALKAMAPDSDSDDNNRRESSQGTPPFYFGPLEIKSPQPTTGAQTAAAEQQHRATSSVACCRR